MKYVAEQFEFKLTVQTRTVKAQGRKTRTKRHVAKQFELSFPE